MKRDALLITLLFPLTLAIVSLGYYFYDLPVTALLTGLNVQIVFFFQYVTYLGVSTWYLIGSAALFMYYRFTARNWTWTERMFYLFSSVAVSGLLTDAIKWLMGRWRPKVFLTEGFYGFGFFGTGYEQTSFPSGHATTICSLAFVLSVLFPRFKWLWVTIALLVCLSRVVIGAHYLSDVVMGAYIGIFVSFLLRKWPHLGKSIKGRLTS